jgi:lysozyme
VDIYEQIKRDEGIRLKLYIDTVDKATIGCGRNLTDVGISQDEVFLLLYNDVTRARF